MKSVPDTRESLLIRLGDPSDEAARREFLEVYRSLIYRLACRQGFQDADAEDVAQQALLAVAGAIGRWRQGEHRLSAPGTVSFADQTAVIELLPHPPAFDREQMITLFRQIDGDGNQYLEPAEAEGLAFIKRAFRVMDHKADGKIFADEFLDYARHVSLIAPWQVVAAFQTQSRNLFEPTAGQLRSFPQSHIPKENPSYRTRELAGNEYRGI